MNVDNYIAELLIKNNNIFKHVNPNIITLVGFILNYVIWKNINCSVFIAIVLLLRYLSDLLDGAVARKYNKTSKLGSGLDITSDFIFTFIFMNMVAVKFLGIHTKYVIAVFMIYVMIMIHTYDLLSSHDEITQYHSNKNFIKNVVPFISNNTFIFYIIYYVMLCMR
jgi:phosphatidylglycerophosphate synthase